MDRFLIGEPAVSLRLTTWASSFSIATLGNRV